MGQLGRIKVGQVAGQAGHIYLCSKAGGPTLSLPLLTIFTTKSFSQDSLLRGQHNNLRLWSYNTESLLTIQFPSFKACMLLNT